MQLPAEWIERFALIPGYDPAATAASGDWFDVDAADKAIDFFPQCLQFIEGEKAGQPFRLEPWQQAIIGCMFGWKRSDGTRRYREVLIYVPRKNGKTPMCAGIVLYTMFADHEPGAQIYSAAAEREQAALVFRHAAGMVARQPALAKRAKVYKTFKSIEYQAENTFYKALSADADTKHGFSSHVVIVDELHAHPNGELVDVLQTSMAARRNPLMVHITTADYQRDSVCNRKHEYGCKVRDGIIADPSFLPVIYEASIDDDWTSEDTWRKANPNYGVSVNADYLRRECERAKAEATYENTFKRLHLNIKTTTDVRWLRVEDWDACEGDVDGILAELRMPDCFIGLDLSSKIDLTAKVRLYPLEDKWLVKADFYCPQERIEQRAKKDRVPYDVWAREGWLTPTPGNVVDQDAIERDVIADGDHSTIREVAYDPWNASQLAVRLEGAGVTVVEMRQGYASLSEPSKTVEAKILDRSIVHDGNPVLRWMISNVMAEMDPAGNIKPSKKKSTERIDGVVALVMAVARAMVAPEPTESAYESRGMLYASEV